MNHDTLQQLLEKYHEGTLTDEEREQLNSLTHRDEVFASAVHQARTIVRTRIIRIAACIASLLVVGGAILWTQIPHQQAEMIARQEPIVITPQANPESPIVVEQPEEYLQHPTSNEKRKTTNVKRQTSNIKQQTSNVQRSTSNVFDQVVVCNNKCEADSVINEIRNFLSV